MFTKLLIANRGEIAQRVLFTAHRLGVKTVAVVSEADRGAPYARLAGEVVEIGPGPATESYLRGDRIIAAAKATGAEAIHPGYGFLAENADFADAVLDTGAPVGDSMVRIEGLETPVAPGSTVGGAMVVNSIKSEVAQRLVAAGQPPRVLTAGAVVGAARATELFEAAYDEHGRRLAKLFASLGE